MSWDEYCVICGAPYDNKFYITDEDDSCDVYRIEYPELKWLTYSYCLTEKEELYKTRIPRSGYAKCGKNKFSLCLSQWFINIYDGIKAISCHRKCHQLLLDEFNYKLNYQDLLFFLDQSRGNAVLRGEKNYGRMKKYSFGQDFVGEECLENDKWLLEDPNINMKNRKRIIKTWKPYMELIKFGISDLLINKRKRQVKFR